MVKFSFFQILEFCFNIFIMKAIKGLLRLIFKAYFRGNFKELLGLILVMKALI